MKTGIFGIKDGEITLFVDAETGDAYFKGHVEATSGTFSGTITALNGEIGDFEIKGLNDNDTGRWLTASNRTMGLSGSQLFFKKNDRTVYVGSHPNESVGGNPIAGYFNIGPTTSTLKSAAKCAVYATVPVTRVSDILGGWHALYADHGDVTVKDGYFRGPNIAGDPVISYDAGLSIYLTLQQTLVAWNGASKSNIVLPDGALDGHTVIFHAGTGRKADMGIICSNDAKINYRGTAYNWINVSNTRLTIIVRKIGRYWFATHEEEWTTGFGN